MSKIEYRNLSANGPVEVCRELSDRLYAHQAERGKIRKDVLAAMRFDTRLKPSFEEGGERFLLVAYDGDRPVGYVFANAWVMREEFLDARPGWAQDLPADSQGFYPRWLPTPCKIADLNNLYVLPEYRGEHIGQTLAERALEWMRQVPEVRYLFVHVSNGNDAGTFYEKLGFRHSHPVFNGFIEAYWQGA